MKIYYNTDTRQLIIMKPDFACAIYLQSDETPETKAKAVVLAYRQNKANVSVCEEIILNDDGKPLPIEDGPKPDRSNDVTNTTNGDGKTE